MGFFSDLWDDVTDFFSDAVDFVVDLVMAPIEWVADLFTPDIPDYSSQIDEAKNLNKGTTVNRRGGDNAIPLIYSGYNQFVKLGSVQAYIATAGTDNKFLHLTYVLCHSADIDQVILGTNETQMRFGSNWKKSNSTDFVRRFDLSSSSSATNDITVKNKDKKTVNIIKMHVQRHTGTNITQPSWHTDKNQYAGLISIKIRLQYDNTPYPNTSDPVMGKIPNIIYYVASSEEKTEVDFLQDYLTNATYGAGFDASVFDATSFSDTKALLNNIVGTRTTPNVIGTSKSYYRVNVTSPVINNVQNMLNHMGCSLLFENGKFFLKPDTNMIAYYNQDQTYLNNLSVFQVTEHDVIGGVSFENAPSSSKAFKYINQYNQTGNMEYTWPQDTQVEIKKLRDKGFKVTMPNEENTVSLFSNGHRIMKWRWAEDQIRSNIAFTVTAKHANIKPYDLIEVYYPQINFNNELYVVTKADLQPNLTVKVVAKRYIKDTALGISADVKIGDRSFYDLLVDQGYTHIKTPVVVPSGSTYAGTPTDDGTAPTDGNTQVDEFIPGTEPPEIANLTVEVVNQDAVYNSGQYIPTIRVKWDEIREPNINNYKIFVRRISKGPRYNTLVTDTELNDISFSAEFMAPGKSYIIQVVPYNNGYPGITATETVTIPNVDYNRDEIINLTVEWPYDTHPYGYVLGQHGNSDGTLNEDPGGVDHAEWIDFISGTYYKWEDFDGAAWAKMVPYNSTLDQELWSPNPNILSMEFDEEIPMSEGDWAVITGSVTAFEHYWTAGPTSATNKYHSLWDDEGLADSTSSYMRNVPLYYLYYTIYDSSDSVISTIGGAASPANGDPQDGLIIDCRGATNAAYVKVGVNFADPLISSSNQYGKYWVAVQDVALQIHKNIQLSKNWQGVTITSTTAYELPNQASKVARYVTGGNTSDIQPIQEALFATATPTDAETSFFMGRYAGETGTGPLNHKHNVRAVEISTGNPISSVFADITLVGIPTVIQQTVPSGTTNIPRKYVIVK